MSPSSQTGTREEIEAAVVPTLPRDLEAGSVANVKLRFVFDGNAWRLHDHELTWDRP